MQAHTFTLSENKDESRSKDIFFNSYQNEKEFIITCKGDFELLTLCLNNSQGQTDSEPFYKENLGVKYIKEPYHNFLVLEKSEPLPSPIEITIHIF